MLRLKCRCGLVTYPGPDSCPECGRSTFWMTESHEEVTAHSHRDEIPSELAAKDETCACGHAKADHVGCAAHLTCCKCGWCFEFVGGATAG